MDMPPVLRPCIDLMTSDEAVRLSVFNHAGMFSYASRHSPRLWFDINDGGKTASASLPP